MKIKILGLILVVISGATMADARIENNICINDYFGEYWPNPIITCTVMKNDNVISKCYMGSLKIKNLYKSNSDVYINNCALKQLDTKATLISSQKLKIQYQNEGQVIEKEFTAEPDGFFRAIINLNNHGSHQIACVTQCASNHYFPIKF